MVSRMPTRFVIAFLCFWGFICAYSLRVILNVAIVAMVKEPVVTTHTGPNESSTVACYHLITENNIYNSSIPNLQSKGEFEWNSNMQGLVLGSFYYGYAASHIPGGLIAGAIGPKKVFGFGIFITAMLSFLIPMAARWNVWALIVARVIQGIGEGACCPAAYMIMSRWAPREEISRTAAFVINGMYVGVVISQYVSGFLCDSDFLGGWPSTFYVFGLVGFVWFTLWMVFVYDFPKDHPRISEEELSYIRQGKEESSAKPPVPWKTIFKSRVFWGLMVSHITENWGFYTLLTDLPTYLSNVLHVSLEVNGAINSVSNIMPVIFSYFASIIADRLISGGRLSVTYIRKLMTSIGSYIPCIALLVIAYVGCHLEVILVCLAVAIGVNGFVQAGFLVTFMEIAPEHTGIIFGMTGGMSNLSGFLAPSVVGYLIQNGNTLENWRNVFVLTSAIFFVCGTSFNILCNSKNQNWGSYNKEAKNSETTPQHPIHQKCQNLQPCDDIKKMPANGKGLQ